VSWEFIYTIFFFKHELRKLGSVAFWQQIKVTPSEFFVTAPFPDSLQKHLMTLASYMFAAIHKHQTDAKFFRTLFNN